MKSWSMWSVLGFAVGTAGVAIAEDGGEAAARAMPLSEILAAVEERESRRIEDVELDDGLWEIDLFAEGGDEVTIHVDPRTGEERRRAEHDDEEDGDDRPPGDALPLSRIVAAVEAREPGTIVEIGFDDDKWEVEMIRDGREVEFEIDPRTGDRKRD